MSRYEYVPGVRVSGTIRIADRISGKLTISGRMKGKLTVKRNGTIRGVLARKKIRARASATAGLLAARPRP